MAKAKKYQDIAENVVDLLGGKDNIVFFTHCVTRLRFNVKDKTLVKKDEVDKLDKVIGEQWSGEQFQIIIGQDVGTAYKEVIEETGLSGDGEVPADDSEAMPKKKFSFNRVIDGIAGSITPLIPVLIGAGMIKVLLLLLTMIGALTTKSPTYQTLTFISDAGFYFLPVFVGATAAKKFGANQGLGMFLGAVLIHPTFAAAVAAGKGMSLFGIGIYSASYSSTIFPSILAVFLLAYVERFLTRWVPDSLKSMVVPFFALLIVTPITLWILAPAGSFIGTYMTKFMLWLYSTTGFLSVGLLAGVLPLLVMTGMHTTFAPYLIQTMASVGKEPLFFCANVISNLDQGAASLAVGIKTKHNLKLRSTALSCAVTAIVAGVTEPAMFGVNLKLKKPLYAGMIGSVLGGLVAGLGKVYCYAFIGSGGLFALPAFLGPSVSNLIWFLVAVAVGMIATFILTMVMYKEEAVQA
ncbi:PTS transporter subunit EIIC [Lacticaseibacillus paracasei]|uniref:PTS transporter subunit EIIC n=1 Tax=Lacticaseibacillus paracasei TaxID=1597 RepID=UPI003313758A